MPNTFQLTRIAGIPIQVHYTWLFALALIAWSLSSGFFPSMFPGWDAVTYWLVAIVSALALFVSVLIHELSHSLFALSRGLQVQSITLFIFGGVSNIAEEAESPGDEFIVAVVGPLASVVLAVVFWAIGQILPPGPTPLNAVVGYLAFTNILLAAFNMVPGFPLDGGRVLRSALWAATGSMRRATQIASYVGQGIGFVLIFLGVAQLLGGNFLGGLWIAFIGWFLNSGAEASRQQVVLRESLRGVRVADVMKRDVLFASPETTTEEFLLERVLRQGLRAVPVMEGGQVVGIVSITDAKEIPPEAWPTTPVGKIMTPTPLRTVRADEDLSKALQLMVDGTLNQLPVMDQGALVGLLTRADLLRFIQMNEELGLSPRARNNEARARSRI
jgi:Zn-dependent protease/CBS domain-containing protein